MRSRYSAYALGLIDYLVATTLPAQQSLIDRSGIEAWSTRSTWLGLSVEIIPRLPINAMRRSLSQRVGLRTKRRMLQQER